MKMRKTIKQNLKGVVFAITYPVIKEFAFFFIAILLQIIPVVMYSYFTYNNVLYFNSVRSNAFVFSFPYILYMPICFAYIGCIFLSVIRNYNNRLHDFAVFLAFSFLFVLEMINSFLLIHFQTMITSAMIQLAIETNSTESSEFVDNFVFQRRSCYVLFYLLLILFFLFLCIKNKNRIRAFLTRTYCVYIIFVFLIFSLIKSIPQICSFLTLFSYNTSSKIESWNYEKYNSNVSVVTNFIYSLYFILASSNEYDCAISNSLEIKKSDIRIVPNSHLNIVVVIGESFSKYHSSLYSYKHRTNPNLENENKNGNLFVFNNVISPFNLTSAVVKNVFSTNSIMNNEAWYQKPLFPVIFKRAGYEIYFWDNQKDEIKGFAGFSLNSFLYNPKVMKMSYDFVNKSKFKYDDELINDFKYNACISNKNNLFIFHLMGQHLSASDRYPKRKEFCLYNLDSLSNLTKPISEKTYIYNYDNATLYNDFVVERIINIFRNKNAVLIYFSDHGEEVYDYRHVVGRTHEFFKTKKILKYQYEVPFMIWCSNEYKEKNKGIVNMINQSLNKPYMTDNLSHLLFTLGYVNTKYYNEECDILRYNYVCKPRFVQDIYNYDKIMKQK